MKKVLILFLLMPVLASGQIVDDFEQANLNKWICPVTGHWKADATTTLSGRYALRHSYDNSLAGFDQIGISLQDLKPISGITTWSFKIRHGYNPSSTNSWGVFLMSDAEPSLMMPGANVNGYAVGVNLSGYDDTLRLWKIKNGTVTKVLNSKVNWEKDIGTTAVTSIYIERSSSGEWKLSVLKGSGQPLWLSQATDNELFPARWFGIYYKYTSTGDKLLWVDDVKIDGVFYTDSIPPHPDTLYITGKKKLVISFDEAPDLNHITPENFVLNPGGLIASEIKSISEKVIEIYFGNDFKNKTENEIVIKSLCDTSHNCINNVILTFTPLWAERGDVVISEIMADPVPSVGLAENEYLEITNNSDFEFNLKGWTIVSGNSVSYFPEKIIAPNDIIILCSVSDTSILKEYGRVIGLKSFPVLTDQGKLLVLNNGYGDMIHGVEYSATWYGDALKSEGGWSLELRDKNWPFYYEGNWTSSDSRSGGTPGLINSVSGFNPDNYCPEVLNIFPSDSGLISVTFSEPILDDDDIVSGVKINGIEIKSYLPADPLFRKYSFVTGQALNVRTSYELTFNDQVTDFSGNPFCLKNYIFGIPEHVSANDIQFNELLFNPYPGSEDYIEFYNCSEKVIDASVLLLISIDDATGDTSEYVTVSDVHRCIMPGSYYVITINKREMENQYIYSIPNSIFEVKSLVSMSDEEGHLVILNKELDKIDEVLYDEKMHFALLTDFEGVALEKIRPCLLSVKRENWHSASESSGWGTPGTLNSVFTDELSNDDRVTFSSTKITPDNDGFEDFLVIDLKFRNEGNVITVSVFDEAGYCIKDLANNLSTGINDSLNWDGTDNTNSLVKTGIYIVYFSGFDETGKISKWKKVCTVLRR